MRRILLSVFPPPRRPVTVAQAAPLVVFLLAYAAVCILLEWTDRVLFVRPVMFALMAVTPWVWWLHVSGFSGLSRGRSLASLLVRLTLVGLFVMLLAEPRAVRTSDTLSVVYVVDLSDSIDDGSVGRALEFVAKTVYEKPVKDEAGLIVFGRSAAVEQPPRMSFFIENEGIPLNARVQRDATNLEQALSLAAAMLPEDSPGRIVLVSDGTQTEGSTARILDDLKARQIPVDVLPIEYDYNEEVWLERIDLPRFVKIGENYEAQVVLASLQAGRGELVLSENGQPVYREQIEFPQGKSRYDIPIKLRGAGYYEYAATIVPSGENADHQARNNRVSNYLYVAGEGKVLLVVDPQGDRRDWDRLERALIEGERQVELMTAYDFPRDALSLLPYDAIAFVNAPADAFDAVQLRAVHDAVKDLGVGFLMVGGANSFGPGGYHRTAIEEALPVTMDVSKKKILPKGALAIILHTCEFPEGNTWAKRITKEAIRVMSGQDEVGVLLYDMGGERWLFPLTPASEYESLVTKINAAEPGDMPFFGTTMQLGLSGLKASDASLKHMVIITDADPQSPPPQLLKQFIDARITVSIVAIFPHGGAQSPDIQRSQAIVGVTGGRFYFPQDPRELPGIFIKEAKTLNRNMVQNKTFSPEIGYPSEILDGIRAMPDLHGYVLTTPKPRGQTVLRVPLEEDDQVDPLLSVWQFGLGRAGAFTSDLSTNWGADWVEWEKFRAFVKQLTTYIARVKQDSNLRLWSYTSGSEAVIVAEDFAPEDSFLDVRASLTGPDDRAEQVTLKQIGPRRYQATVPLWGKGNYQVLAVGQAGERTERAQDGFIVPYSPEYLRFRANPIALREISDQTGGAELTKDSTANDIYGARREPKQSSRPVFDWFLIALACLVPLDVAVRRIQIDVRAIRDWLLLRRRGPSTETMSALLRRKREVDSGLEAQREAAPVLQRPAAAATRRAVPSRGERTAAKEGAAAATIERPEDATTTSRLLEMKRRRQQDRNT